MIDKKRVSELASLAKLKIEDDRLEEFKDYLNDMEDSLEDIKSLDLDNVKINYHVNNDRNALAEDEIKDSMPREQVLKNTVESQYGYFKILKVVD